MRKSITQLASSQASMHATFVTCRPMLCSPLAGCAQTTASLTASCTHSCPSVRPLTTLLCSGSFDYATPVDQQFQFDYDLSMQNDQRSRSPAASPVRHVMKRPRHAAGEQQGGAGRQSVSVAASIGFSLMQHAPGCLRACCYTGVSHAPHVLAYCAGALCAAVLQDWRTAAKPPASPAKASRRQNQGRPA